MIKNLFMKVIAGVSAFLVMCTTVMAQSGIVLDMKTEKAGNIFGYDEDTTIMLNIQNTSDALKNLDVNWCVINEADDSVAESGNGKISVEAGENQTFDVNIDCDKFGLYRIEAEVSADGPETSDILKFSKVLSSDKGERNSDFGFASHVWRYGSYLESVDLMQKAGAGGWSDGINWVKAEAVKGSLILNSANKKAFETSKPNTENMLIIGYGNPDYITRYDESGNKINVSDVYPPITESELKAFGDYCSFMAKETKGVVKRFQIWNEWELDGTNPERLDASYYVEILKTAYEAIKKVNSKAEVVGMGGAIITSDGSFDEEALKAGAMNYCDAVSLHVYDYHRMTYFPNQRVIDDVKERVELYKSYMTDKILPIYISETGWSTTSTAEAVGASAYSEKDQAENLVKSFVAMKAFDLGDKMYWYDFQDDGEDETEREHRFGVVTSRYNEDGALLAKPSYLAAAAMNKIMAGGVHKVENDKFQSYTETEKMWSIWGDWKRIDAYVVGIYPFERENLKSDMGKNVAVLWSKPEKTFKISTGAERITVYDIYGNAEILYSDNGIYDISIEDEILYLSGDFKFFNINNQSVSIESVEYDDSKNLVTVKGSAEGMSKFDIELCENGEVVQNEICGVRDDGSFEKVISVRKDGLYTLYAGRESIENYASWLTPFEVKRTESASMDSQIGSVIVTGDGNNIRISGHLLNAEKGENVSLMLVSSGKKPTAENIIYVNQIMPDENGAFMDEILIDNTIKVVDVYIGANYADKATSEYVYDICRVTSFNLEELSGNFVASAIVDNRTTETKEHTIIISQYDESGVLLEAVSEKWDVVPYEGEKAVLTLTVPKNADVKKCSAFIWDSINKLSPLFQNAEIDIQEGMIE